MICYFVWHGLDYGCGGSLLCRKLWAVCREFWVSFGAFETEKLIFELKLSEFWVSCRELWVGFGEILADSMSFEGRHCVLNFESYVGHFLLCCNAYRRHTGGKALWWLKLSGHATKQAIWGLQAAYSAKYTHCIFEFWVICRQFWAKKREIRVINRENWAKVWYNDLETVFGYEDCTDGRPNQKR